MLLPTGGFSQCSPASRTVEGRVFIDNNLNGIFESSETGKSGVLVQVYGAENQLLGSAISGNSGSFSIAGLIDGTKVRLTFGDVPSYGHTKSGVSNGTNVQFVQVPACNISYGVGEQKSLCNEETEIITTCFVRGSTSTGNVSEPTIVAIKYGFDTLTGARKFAMHGETGSIWGLAYRRNTKEIFSSSFVKQHSGLKEGHDAIFISRLNGGMYSTTLFVNLKDLGVDVGTLTETDETKCSYGHQVGKIGLGGVSVSPDDRFLYVVNIYNNTLVKIDIDNPVKGSTETFQIPGAGYHAFALKYHEGKIYLGITKPGDIAKVLAFDPILKTFSETGVTVSAGANWTDTPILNSVPYHWLTDIDFSDKGDMILALSDRIGHMFCNSAESRLDEQKGDLIIAFKKDNGWELEDRSAPGKEFFSYDFWVENPGYHPETTLGGIYVMPGQGSVVSAVFDPHRESYSGGLHRYSTSNGTLLGAKELYTRQTEVLFGKASGFGDITAICPSSVTEIGNLVWVDTNKNGLQDADESGIADVSLHLYDDQCTLVSSTVTDTYGRYYFNDSNVAEGIVSNRKYYVGIDPKHFNTSTTSYVFNSHYYNLTGNVVDQDHINSDGKATLHCGVMEIYVENIRHNFDIGLSPAGNCDLKITKTVLNDNAVKVTDVVRFRIVVKNSSGFDMSSIEIGDKLPTGYLFEPGINLGWTNSGGLLKFVKNKKLIPGDSDTSFLALTFDASIKNINFDNEASILSAVDGNGVQITDIKTCFNEPEDGFSKDFPKVCDLALMHRFIEEKVLSPGSLVTITSTVCNQGNLDAKAIEVVNYTSDSLTYIAAENSLKWVLSTDRKYLIYRDTQTLAPNTCRDYNIKYKLSSDSTIKQIVNYAEINGMQCSGTTANLDFDSTPDRNDKNDKGGQPNTETDNMITDHNVLDEDDHDPAIVSVQFIDLSIRKHAVLRRVVVGTIVNYFLDIKNLGQAPVSRVLLRDYLPIYLTLIDSSWTLSGDVAEKSITFSGNLQPGATHRATIRCQVNDRAVHPIIIKNKVAISEIYDQYGIQKSNLGLSSLPADDSDIIEKKGLTDDDVSSYDISLICPPVIDFCSGQCIVGTTSVNGMIGTYIKFAGIKGDEWRVFQSEGLYDTTSTRGNPLPLSDPYILKTQYHTDDYDDYVFKALQIDGKGFSVTFINKFGETETISNVAGFCSLTKVNLTGPAGVCLSSGSSKYVATVVSTAGGPIIYDWVVDADGSSQTTDTLWNRGPILDTLWSAIGNQNIRVFARGQCNSPGELNVSVSNTPNGSMVCSGDMKVGLGEHCSLLITPSMLAAGVLPNETSYVVMLTDSKGNPISNATVTKEHAGTIVMAKLIEICSGNSCWSWITVEDKMPPVALCKNIELTCFALANFDGPFERDNCGGPVQNVIVSETVTPVCHDTILKYIDRVYLATDKFGNRSDTCRLRITVLRPNLSVARGILTFPVDRIKMTAVSCDSLKLYAEGRPSPVEYGRPKFGPYHIYPTGTDICNIVSWFTDKELKAGCIKKIIRTWHVYEQCGSLYQHRTHEQVIEILDTKGPRIEPLPNVTISTSGHDCAGEYLVPVPVAIDTCNNEVTIDIIYSGGIIRNIKQPTKIKLAASGLAHVITVRAYDECLNSHQISFTVKVEDNTAPTAICKGETVAGLNSKGEAYVYAHHVNDGSYDECDLSKILIRRMNPSKCLPCDAPNIPGFTYVGEFLNPGKNAPHHYYVSKHKALPGVAAKIAAAVGGYLVQMNNSTENQWVLNKYLEWNTSEDYIIGLRDAVGKGDFSWYNNQPSNYLNWESGFPVDANITPLNQRNDSIYVRSKHTNGKWVNFGNESQEYLYIVEVENPCGFSESLKFCCDDVVTNPHIVVFRAVDKSGNWNECMVNVTVQDKFVPKITCPNDATIDCSQAYDDMDLSGFGRPTVIDACNPQDSMLRPVFKLNSCRVGTIERTFRAYDGVNSATCTQIITVTSDEKNRFNPKRDVDFPNEFYEVKDKCSAADLEPDNLPAGHGRPAIRQTACSMASATHKDEIFTFATGACYKILRTWTVIDWCEMARLGGSYVPERFVQTIKVNNTVPPFFVGDIPERDTLVTAEGNCTNAIVNLEVTGRDSCTPDNQLRRIVKIDNGNDGIYEHSITGVGHINRITNRSFPVGITRVQWSFEDACGNIVTRDQIILVQSSGKPVAVALEKISVSVEPWDVDGDGKPDVEKVCINAASLDASSYSTCCEGKPLRFSFSANPDSTKMCFDCRHVGKNIIIQLWVHDCNGKTDFVNVKIDVQDNNSSDICKDLCVDNPVVVLISGNNNICQGRSTTLTAQGANGYIWSTGENTASITVNPAITTSYTVIGTGLFGCADTASITVNVIPSPQVTITGGNICSGGSTTITATGGGNYLWSTGATTAAISVSPVSSTTYTVTVTGANGCTSALSRIVLVSQPPVVEITGNNSVCINQSTTLTATGGASYIWSNQATASSITVTPLSNTTYTVTATDTNGCTATGSITVTVNGLTINPVITGDTSICIGESTVLTASGGISYRWSTSSTNTSITVSPTANTSYSVTITDSNGCTGIANKTVIVNPNPTVTISGATVFCSGNPLTLTASGAITYLWSTGQTTSSISVSPAAPTVYRVTGTDSNGCVDTDTIRVILGDLSNVSITGDNLICPGDSTTLRVVGGVSYVWSTGSTIDSIRVSPSVTTTYSVTVTVPNGCTAVLTRTVTLRTPPTATISGNLSICPGSSTMLTASGGASFIWSTGATSATIVINPSVSTNYSVTVTDTNGCRGSSSVTVNTLTPPNIQISGDNTICQGDSTILTASGGNSYIWSTGATTNQIIVRPTSTTTYTVTATGANGCTAISSVVVTLSNPPTVAIAGVDTVCTGISTLLTASGGGTYVWNTGATTASINVTVNVATIFIVTVTDINGCTASASKQVNTFNPPNVNITGDLVICIGESTTLTASGGVSYIWSNQATSSSITVSPTVTTPYTVTVTDSKGCSATRTATVSVDPGTLICSTRNFTAHLGPNGSVTISPADISTGSMGSCPNITARVTPAMFFCNDVDRTITVTLIVKNTITNDSLTCTAQVTVRDTIDPVISCPANLTVNCETFDPNAPLSTYGNATATDNCPVGLTIIEGPVIRNLNICNAGQIIRTFVATDRSGNSTQCVQIITVRISGILTVADITFPPNITVTNCQGIDTSMTGRARITRTLGLCSRVSISFTDNPPPQNPLCAQVITRTWRVIDTCQLLAGTNNGIFSFNQTITITNQPPVINGPAVLNVIADNEECIGTLEGVFHNAIGCNITLLSNSQNNLPSFDISGQYPVGSTTVTFTVRDACNNIVTRDVIVQVTDTSQLRIRCIKAFPEMTDQLFVDAPVSMYYEITTNCDDNRAVIASFSSSNQNDNIKRWNCSDVNTVFSFSIYFFHEGQSTHFFTCNNAISRTLDPNNFCGSVRPVVSGNVKTENNQAVKDVAVELEGSNGSPVMSDKDGKYKFPDMPTGGKYDVIPTKNTGILDGVSTMDLIFIQRHILGIESLKSPYQLLAADVNRDYRITAADLTMLRKVILGVQDHFGDNKSWRMVDKNHKFPDPASPHSTPLPEKYHINSLDNSMEINWVGVKIGDVNGSYTANANDNFTVSRAADYNLIINKAVSSVTGKSIPVSAAFDQNMTGIQFSAFVGPIENIKIHSGLMDVHDYHYSYADGILRMSWHNPEGIKVNKGDVMFNIEIKSSQNIQNNLYLTKLIKPELYSAGDETHTLGFRNVEIDGDKFILMGNTPNPWNQSTEIKFFLPTNGEVAVRVRDITGRVIYTGKEYMDKGENIIILNADQLNGSGVLLYDITFGNEVKTMKMLIIR